MALLIAVLVAAVLMLAVLVAGALAVARTQRREAQQAHRRVDVALSEVQDPDTELRSALAELSDVAVADYARDPELASRVQAVFHGAQERLDAEARIDDELTTRIRQLIDVLGRLLEQEPGLAGEPGELGDPVEYLRDLTELAYERGLFGQDMYGRLGFVIQMARDDQGARVRDREYAVREADDALRELRGR